jgi:hypothetical protein
MDTTTVELRVRAGRSRTDYRWVGTGAHPRHPLVAKFGLLTGLELTVLLDL